MSTQVPRLLAGLVDDAAVFPPGSAALPDALAAHRRHRASPYAALVGPLLVPASALAELGRLLDPDEQLAIGVIGDLPLDQLAAACAAADPRLRIRQVEAAVAKRGQDPLPGLTTLAALADPAGAAEPARARPTAAAGAPTAVGAAGPDPEPDVYAEIPLAWGLTGALDRIAAERAAGRRIAAKFRTGGLAAELFPTPAELAAVICACRDRALPFKLTAGLHHAVRNVDPETGFTHHGFVNVLAAVLAAAEGAEVDRVVELLGATDPRPLVAPVGPALTGPRPLWVGFGSCSVLEPLTDLSRLGLVDGSVDE